MLFLFVRMQDVVSSLFVCQNRRHGISFIVVQFLAAHLPDVGHQAYDNITVIVST